MFFNVSILFKTVFLTWVWFYTKNKPKNLFLKNLEKFKKPERNLQKTFGNPVYYILISVLDKRLILVFVDDF